MNERKKAHEIRERDAAPRRGRPGRWAFQRRTARVGFFSHLVLQSFHPISPVFRKHEPFKRPMSAAWRGAARSRASRYYLGTYFYGQGLSTWGIGYARAQCPRGFTQIRSVSVSIQLSYTFPRPLAWWKSLASERLQWRRCSFFICRAQIHRGTWRKDWGNSRILWQGFNPSTVSEILSAKR